MSVSEGTGQVKGIIEIHVCPHCKTIFSHPAEWATEQIRAHGSDILRFVRESCEDCRAERFVASAHHSTAPVSARLSVFQNVQA